ncbi:MAG: restriction endonuclease subunit S [Bryobacteraceae bacterium]|nr:restriction endonuclease subunit S [Bryobacteraceae bacterium]
MTPTPALPRGWCWATLGEIADLKGGLTKGKKRKEGERLRSIPYLRVANVQRGYLDLDEMKLIEATEAEIEELRLRAGDILFNEGGDRDKLGRGWVWQDTLPECIHQNHVFRARLHDPAIEPRFVSWYANSEGAAYFNDQGKQTTNLASINLTRLSEFPVPLAPAPEQRRIVAEMEKQLTRIDAALSALRHANRLVDRFRLAALCIAVTPRREQHPNSTWKPVSLREVLREPLRNGHSAKASRSGQGIRALTLSAVTYRDFGEKNTKITAAQPNKVKGLWLQPGDILIERSNTPELVGSTALYQGEPDYAIFPDLLIRIRTNKSVVPAFLELVLQAESSRNYFRQKAQGSAGTMPKIDQGTIERFQFFLPSVPEQEAISGRVRTLLDLADRLEGQILRALKRAGHLRQAILKRAFEGRLVPQDPNDEPAAQILAGIQSNGRTPVQRGLRKGVR